MTTTTVAIVGLLLSGATGGQPDAPVWDPDCDPDIEDCCPLYWQRFTLEYRHWRACIPINRDDDPVVPHDE